MIVMADELRPDAERIVERLRAENVRHVAMISGDRRSVAERVGRQLGVDRVYAEQSAEHKLEVVRTIRADPQLRPVIMVGDGINDAPALAIADLGIAMGAAGATVSSETADAVITVDRVDRVADAVHTGRRALLHRAPERSRRHGPERRCNGRRRGRVPTPRRRRAVARGHRPRRDPERAARAPRLNRRTARDASVLSRRARRGGPDARPATRHLP